MNSHDEIRTLIEDIQAVSAGWERESAARLAALNEQCDRLLAVIDAAQAGVKALDAREDGWIPWGGGACPVGNNNVIVTVRLRDGETERARVGAFRWCHDGAPWDIVAYKVDDNA